jgi:HEAT repeat protein
MLLVNVEADQALPVLSDALKHDNDEVRIQAAHALAQAGREANRLLPFFKEGLRSKTVRARVQSLQGLAMLGKQATPAEKEILAALHDTDGSVRQQAVNTLQSVPLDADKSLTELSKLLKEDTDQNTRIRIVQTVQRYQQKAVPLLLEALKTKDAQIRQQAVWMMQNIGGDLSAYFTEISALAKDKDTNIRASIIHVLGRTGEKGVLQLADMLTDPDDQVRIQAAAGLQNGGKHLTKVLPVLTKALSDKNPNVRWQVAYAMGQAGEAGAKAMTEAYEKNKDPSVRTHILQAILNGQARQYATPLIKKGLKDPDKEVRRFAVQMVPNLGRSQEAFDALTDALADKESEVRVQAAYAFQNMGPKGMPILEKGLKSAKDAELRIAMVQVLINYNHRSKTMVGPLTAFLKDTNPQVRWASAQLLGNIGPDAKEAVPTLRDLINDSNPMVRQFAQNAINRIEPPKDQ